MVFPPANKAQVTTNTPAGQKPAGFLLFTFRLSFHASSTDDFAINEFGAGGIIY
jgi:hypothetical protein